MIQPPHRLCTWSLSRSSLQSLSPTQLFTFNSTATGFFSGPSEVPLTKGLCFWSANVVINRKYNNCAANINPHLLKTKKGKGHLNVISQIFPFGKQTHEKHSYRWHLQDLLFMSLSNLGKPANSLALGPWAWPTKVFWRAVFIGLPHYVFFIFPPAMLNNQSISFLLITITIADSSCNSSHAVRCRCRFYIVALKVIF